MGFDWEILTRLVLSCVMGGIIGYERQARHKSAGLRTNILVCLGSCLIMILSQGIYQEVEGKTNADPSRLAAQVVSGIGFLGAGSIMKEGITVTGLTTAACLWVVAGVGLAIGAGCYTEAIITTTLVFLICGYATRLDFWLGHGASLTLSIAMVERPGQISRISSLLDTMHLRVRGIRMKANATGNPNDPEVSLELDLESRKRIDRVAVVDAVRNLRGILSVEVL